MEHIESFKTKTRKADLLIEIMRHKTPAEYEVFQSVVRESGQGHVIDLLTAPTSGNESQVNHLDEINGSLV